MRSFIFNCFAVVVLVVACSNVSLAGDDSSFLTDLIIGEKTMDELVIRNKGREVVDFMGQITSRDTIGDETIVGIESHAWCRFSDPEQRIAVSKIGKSCWLWTGTLTGVNMGRLEFSNCSFKACP